MKSGELGISELVDTPRAGGIHRLSRSLYAAHLSFAQSVVAQFNLFILSFWSLFSVYDLPFFFPPLWHRWKERVLWLIQLYLCCYKISISCFQHGLFLFLVEIDIESAGACSYFSCDFHFQGLQSTFAMVWYSCGVTLCVLYLFMCPL